LNELFNKEIPKIDENEIKGIIFVTNLPLLFEKKRKLMKKKKIYGKILMM